MRRSPEVRVQIDLAKVRQNAERIRTATGVPLIAVVKSDAYGLGAEPVAARLADVVERFCVFCPQEAASARIFERTGKSSIAIGPPVFRAAEDYLTVRVQPAVADAEQAAQLRAASPLVCVDTGQQRFACPPERVAEVIAAGRCEEAFTHAVNLDQVGLLVETAGTRVDRLHAAGSSLLEEPSAWLDAVRPGLALYRGAVRVTTRLVEVRKNRGPAGYSGFTSEWHGIILAGYSNGLRAGPCLVSGRPSEILEVGMQSAFVKTEGNDSVGDEVILLGDFLSEQHVARSWNTSPHEVLVRLTAAGVREYGDVNS